MTCTENLPGFVSHYRTDHAYPMTIPATDSAAHRKARGAFFTPPEISRFMTDWAVRDAADVILEPSCGQAAFLLPAAERLRALGATGSAAASQLHGQDIHSSSVVEAREILAAEGFQASLSVGDFFGRSPDATFDAVIGNPPYVRYQNFAGAARARALEAALRQGVRLNQLASSWAAFTVHAASFLKPTGRLALVLPAELLSVKYATQVRKYLLQRFKRVRLVLFENLVFPGVLEEVVLLLAEGSGGADSFEIFQAKDGNDLRHMAAATWVEFTPRGDEKWTGALLPSEAVELYEETLASGFFGQLSDWGGAYLGAVTGNNDFFTLTREKASHLKLEQAELLRISPPGSRHLKGLSLSEHAWEGHAQKGDRCYLFAPKATPSKAAFRYIAQGEVEGVHEAYKCKVRQPWWRVPLVDRPDFLFTYMNHDRPRMVRNGAGVHLLNSLYGVRLKGPQRTLGQEVLAMASLNSLTLLGAEIVGRAYGGGMLKHEPTEANLLPLPTFAALKAIAPKLLLLQPQVGALMRRDDISPATELVDRVLLKDYMKLSDAKIRALRLAREILQQRRMTRGRGSSGKD